MITLAVAKTNYEFHTGLERDKTAHLNLFRVFLREKYPHEYDLDNMRVWKDIEMIHPKHISEFILASRSSIGPMMYESEFNRQIAPHALVQEDFAKLAEQKAFHIAKRERYDISARAIQGHAHEGHCEFKGLQFRNTATLDVVAALETAKNLGVGKEPGFSVPAFQDRTQQWIDDIVAPLDNFFNNFERYTHDVKLTGGRKGPFARMGWLEGQPVNMMELIRGFYFGSQMDSYQVRQVAAKKYGKSPSMGGGSCIPVDIATLKQFPASLGNYALIEYPREMHPLTHVSPEKRMEILKHLGIYLDEVVTAGNHVKSNELSWNAIKNSAHNMRNSPVDVRNVYVRSQRGSGLADDVAIMISSVLPQTFTHDLHREGPNDGISRVIGTYLADLVDTLEKDSFLVFQSGQDETIGNYLNERFRRLAASNKQFRSMFNVHRQKNKEDYTLVSESALTDFVAASINEPVTIHSSQRYFVKDLGGTCAVNEYLKFFHFTSSNFGLGYNSAASMPNEMLRNDINLTFSQIPAHKVYHEMGRRFDVVRNPETRERKVARLYSELPDLMKAEKKRRH